MATATSQNGWTVIPSGTDKRLVKIPRILGRVRKGDVATIFTDLVTYFDENIEDVDQGKDDWGYAFRSIRGQSSGYSNHASATAVDINAMQHPLGASGTFSRKQTEKIRAMLRNRYLNKVRWGGDYRGRKDEMHFEIDGNAADLRKVVAHLKKINGKRIYSTSVRDLLANAKAKAPRPKSNDVLRLQRLLRHAGCMSTPAILLERGKYGPLTRAAVREAQLKAGFTGSDADGYIGLSTLKWLAKRAEGTKFETRAVQ